VLDRKQYIADMIEGLSTVHQAIIKMASTILDELGISYTQMFILSYIKRNEGVSLKKLAATIGITSSAATQQVDNLVKKGFLVREQSNVDRRLLKICLAGKMDKRIEKLQTKYLDHLYAFFDVISDEELVEYYKIHSKIMEHILQKQVH